MNGNIRKDLYHGMKVSIWAAIMGGRTGGKVMSFAFMFVWSMY